MRGASVFSMGQFSRITGLTVKTLRLYHEKGLLEPELVDPATSYRYYGSRNVEQARAIAYLRQMEFPLVDIKEIMERFEDKDEILSFLEKQRTRIEARLSQLGQMEQSLEAAIKSEREAQKMLKRVDLEVREKEVQAMDVAGLRWKGRYDETGKAFQRLSRTAGRTIAGKGMNLYYDSEYKEEDADIESCFAVRQGIKASGDLKVHRLAGGPCVSLIHKGPYDQLSRAYARVFEYVQRKKYETLLPIREVYRKGPGMIFQGNPKNYLTEIQIRIAEAPKE